MIIPSPDPRVAPPFEKSFKRKKQFAFLTLSLASFCLLCFIGSVFVTGFETSASLELISSHKVDDSFFANVVSRELESDNLSNHIQTAINNATIVDSGEIVDQDFEKIKSALSFRTMPHQNGNQYRLIAVYSGMGTEIEQNLTESIIRGIAHRIEDTDNVAEASRSLQHQFEIVQSLIEAAASGINRELEVASRLANDLNQELSIIHESVESLNLNEQSRSISGSVDDVAMAKRGGQLRQLVDELQTKLDEFQQAGNEQDLFDLGKSIVRIKTRLDDIDVAVTESRDNSIRIINASMPETNSAIKSILDLLEACDVDSIQSQIGATRDQLRRDSRQLREEVTEMDLLTEEFSGGRYIVNSISNSKTNSAETQPGIGYLIILGLISVVIGSVVSTYYRPEVEGIGFDSKEQAGKWLNLPIIANIAEPTDQQELGDKQPSWANTTVRYAEVALFGFVLLTALLCLFQSDLRQAFLDSPLYGLSKMSGMFFG